MILTPRAEDFLGARPFVFTREVSGIQTGMTALSVLAAFLIGATAIGADWNHGTLGTLLLWEPRRIRVFLAKLAAVLGLTALATALAYAAGIGGAWAVARGFGFTGELEPGQPTEIALVAARGLALAIAAAACSFAIALTAKRTAAALGVLLAYIAVAEIGLRGFFDESERWLVSSQLIAWTQERYEYYVGECAIGTGCSIGQHTIGLTQAGVYLAILTVAALAAAAVIFRRREVT
jgi:ABC-2 type transport system permease protein